MMRKIALVTNLHEQCGNAAYGRCLLQQLVKFYAVEVVEDTTGVPGTGAEAAVINWHPARVALDQCRIADLTHRGIKTILVYQNSDPHRTAMDSCPFVLEATATVSHQRTDACGPVRFIPHGVLEVGGLPEVDVEPCIGTAGFAFPWKNFDAVVDLAKILGVRARIVSPPYAGRDFSPDHRRWQDKLGDQLELHSDFMPEEEVVRLLARNWFNVFPFESLGEDDALGQSGAARLGVSAMRPLVLSQHPKLSGLREFEGSYYGYGSPSEGGFSLLEVAEELLEEIRQGHEVRRPDEIVRCTGWSVTGKMYRDLIEEVSE